MTYISTASSTSSTSTYTSTGSGYYTGTSATITYGDDTSYTSGGYMTVRPSKNLLKGKEYNLPDGSTIKIDDNGNFIINDKNANVTYKANKIREFNKFINASDLLEMFIKDCGKMGAKQNQILDIPIELFINWLIIKAAEADGDEPPEDSIKLLKQAKLTPKCKCCGRFMHKWKEENGINFCNPKCLDKFQRRIKNAI
jgi:hypothetical protein